MQRILTDPTQRRRLLTVLVVVVLLVAAVLWQRNTASQSQALTAVPDATDVVLGSEPSDPVPSASATAVIGVDVIGAVMQPGVYYVPPGARVDDVVKAAGGLAPNADRDAVNMAARVVDAQQIKVPGIGEGGSTAGPSAGSASGATSANAANAALANTNAKVNINTADGTALATLEGIGPAMAQRIIDYRTENGPFQVIDDLQNVKGIGTALFDKIKDHVRVDDQ